MAALGEAAARWAPGLWRRAVRTAAWLRGRRFASGGTQVRAADTGWAAGARGASRAGLGAGFPTSECHSHLSRLGRECRRHVPCGRAKRTAPGAPRDPVARGGDLGAGDSGPQAGPQPPAS